MPAGPVIVLESGQALAGRHRLVRSLGAGAAAGLWLARDAESGADRVLKVLLSRAADDRAAFLRAARLQQQVRHPAVQSCLAVHDGDPPLAVYAQVPAGDLGRLRGQPVRTWLPALVAVAEGIEAMHAQGLVHRDLKPGNVLLSESGHAEIADFGLAAEIGDTEAPRGGSPFSMSPGQAGGAAPTTADDLHGFGALAYELATGYPPFYPDGRPAQDPAAAPEPIPPRFALPEPLAKLVMRCLAGDPRARPGSMSEVAAGLRALVDDAARAPRVERPAELVPRPPPPSDAVIDPAWRRPAPAGPTPEQMRSQGFRRGLLAGAFVFLALAAGFVVFVLPKWVERDSGAAATSPVPAAVAPAPPATDAVPDPATDLRKLAEWKRLFDELRPEVAARVAEFEARGAGRWGGDAYSRAGRSLVEADDLAGQREFETAVGLLRSAGTDLGVVEERAASTLKAALAAGAAALEAGDEAEARARFELALLVDPASAAAKRGLERAGSIVEVKRLLAEAAQLERSGQAAEASEIYRRILGLDRDTAAAREGLARVQSAAAGAAFAQAISQGLDGLAREDFTAARAAFERAGQIRPGAPEASEGIARVDRALGDRAVTGHLAAASEAEKNERWSVALAEYRKALERDRNLLPAQQGVERAEPRAMLDAELASYLARPERLFAPEVRAAARAALVRAEAIPAPGPVLAAQVASVERLVAGAETPLRIALASDNQTDVTIYRVGRLGAFERKDVELLPGRYTVVGARPGYRDVRREITLLPGSETPTLVIRCEEPI